jgi:ribosomal protein S18 acetylase RimI-like enzyme
MIRPVTPDDTDALMELADAIGLFSPDQLDELRAMLAASFLNSGENQPFWLTDDDNGLVGVAYCEPERMTEGTWNLQLIAIHPSFQKQGRGASLLKQVEDSLVARSGRVLLVETVGTEEFAPVREFYKKNGYVEEARIREFYAEGADKVVFWKSLKKI